MTLCAICFETGDMVSLPGCGHVFHACCILTAAQYDAKCPVCRQVPEGVVPRPRERTALVVVEVADDNAQSRQNWIQYRNRRRRCLNKNPTIRRAFDRLRNVRNELELASNITEREYRRCCRQVWTTNPIIREQLKNITNLRRRERRLERFVYVQLRDRIGSEPT